jgi:hypothetical protein
MALKSQTTALAVSSAAAATKPITAATAALPVQITVTAHGYLQGQIIQIGAGSVVGMTQLNGRAFVVDTPAANTFNLKGVDGTNYGAYVSGGTTSLQTMQPVGQIVSAVGFDGTAAEIDTTNLSSVAKEYLIGLQDFGNVTLVAWLQSDAGQTLLRSIKASAAATPMSITLSDGSIAAFVAFCKQFSFDASGPDTALKANIGLRVTGAPAWFA